MTVQRTRPDAGWVDGNKNLPRGPNGRVLCRLCGTEIPRGRRTFCSERCVHEWRIESDPAYARAEVFKRDHGVCSVCGTDCYTERGRAVFGDRWSGRVGLSGGRIGWPTPYAPRGSLSQYQVERSERFQEAVQRLSIPRGRWWSDWWDMDHAVPIVEGGGLGLDNLRTLCIACHRSETVALAARLAAARRPPAAEPEPSPQLALLGLEVIC